jgi:hypothetical protein
MDCAAQRLLFDKSGITSEQFKRDNYECVQQSRTQWSGGGGGLLGLVMILGSKSSADNQARELHKMCMDARGYTSREVSDEDFERQQSFNAKMAEIVKGRDQRCMSDDLRMIYRKSACKPEDITLEQLSDETSISETEKEGFAKYQVQIADLRGKIQETFRTMGGPKDKEMALVNERLGSQSISNELSLIEGKRTWGDFNKTRQAIFRLALEERSRINSRK